MTGDEALLFVRKIAMLKTNPVMMAFAGEKKTAITTHVGAMMN